MNFPPLLRSWLILFGIIISTGLGAGYTAFLTGSSVAGAIIVGTGVAASNMVTNLMKSPGDRAAEIESRTNPPFPPKTSP